MNRETQEYLLSLDPHRLNRHQHHLLMVLGCYRQTSRETFWPSQKTLAIKCHIGEGLGTESDQRQVRRLIAELAALGILEYESGIGRGNRGSFRFVELETRTNKKETRTKESAFKELNPDTNPDNAQPVRSIEVDLTKPFTRSKALQEQNQSTFGDLISSSENRDDDIENKTPRNRPFTRQELRAELRGSRKADPFDIKRVLAAFAASPITVGKASAADAAVAEYLLCKATVQQIWDGIDLATIRKILQMSDLDHPVVTPNNRIRSLAYFESVVDEIVADGRATFTDQYMEYVRKKIERFEYLAKKNAKKEPQRVMA